MASTWLKTRRDEPGTRSTPTRAAGNERVLEAIDPGGEPDDDAHDGTLLRLRGREREPVARVVTFASKPNDAG